jgi:hypothetical protein
MAQAQEEKCTRQLKLVYETPQPRLNGQFVVSVDLNGFTRPLADSIEQKLSLGDDFIGHFNDRTALFNIKHTEMGKYTVPSVEFTYNNCNYKTNEISYEVIDSLPAVENGLWIRCIKDTDSTFWIIIEERLSLPQNYKDSNWSAGEWFEKMVKYDFFDSPIGYRGIQCPASGKAPEFLIINGKKILTCFSESYCSFEITDRNASIRLTKDIFKNLPPDYVFKDIIIQ